jgi:deoxyribodipyrimidine photolyase-related protein
MVISLFLNYNSNFTYFTMKTLRLILGDQLSKDISSLQDCDKKNDIIMMCEVWNEAKYVRHHIKKIAFIFSAMRHFADELKQDGFKVKYIKLDKTNKKTSFSTSIQKLIKEYKITNLIVTHPGEYRVLNEIKSWKKLFNIEVEIKDDNRFLCGTDEFTEWEQKYKKPRMEYFYRYMRAKHNILIKNNKPVGGKWNYDQLNRKPASSSIKTNKIFKVKPDKITQQVIKLVHSNFSDHFGDLEPFYFAVTRKDALRALRYFISNNLKYFGDYQDVMLEGEPWMYHSHISQYLNVGLLSPIECIDAAEKAYNKNIAPLNCVEGFIRQVLGWREYIRGVYWLKMPKYHSSNFLKAKRKLPDFFWNGETKMNCLKQCILETKQNAYAHHIQRLMILGNFCLLTGIHPKYVNEWYMIVYADAFEWVELPNVTGMILYADAGYVASKPYAAGGNYINKMSNYCKNCEYCVKQKTGDNACPFNYLYWNFFINNESIFKNNPRLAFVYNTLNKMSISNIKNIKCSSADFFKSSS